MATLDVLEKDNALERLNAAGDMMRKALQEMVEDLKLDYSVVGIASMFKIFFGPKPNNYAQALKCDKASYFAFFRRMLASGVFLTPSQYETDFISCAHSDEVIQATLEAFRSCLKS
ncbi:Glutamate-1-semialdehyde 2,1-aminomutase [uncultured archaeon]|nr:Glutamate-1-semialdehyde 2,1-aminomutase [uncultured archaeon]